MLLRRALHAVAANLTSQYNSIYATMLGASPTQLGSIHSVANAVGAIASIPAGWFIDRYSLKTILLIGTVLLAVSSLLYAVAPHWAALYAVMILFYVGMRVTCTSCTVIGARDLKNEERGTSRGICRSLSSVVTLIAPILAAWMISAFGGIEIASLRSLYKVQLGVFGFIFVILFIFVREYKQHGAGRKFTPWRDFGVVFQQGPAIPRFLIMIALMEIPWAMQKPFLPLFAHQIKGANEFMLGGIATTIAIAPLLFSIPLGRLADRFGRKKLLYLLAPISYASGLLLVLANGPIMLLASGLLFGFHTISALFVLAMAAEIVPKELMGRWIGIVGLVRGLFSVPLPLLAGLIWDHIGPEYIFLIGIAVDLLLRLPLLATIHETLGFTPRDIE